MSSPYHPLRDRRKQDPVDEMIAQWREVKAADRAKGQPPMLTQLELMLALLKRDP